MNGKFSDWNNVSSRVTQGSVLGPILFLFGSSEVRPLYIGNFKNTNSEELLEKYKRLIGTLKEKQSKFIVSGILPCIGAENHLYNKAFSTNDRLKSLCSKKNVEFINLWNHFYDQQILFNHDGLHLNPVGSARLGRLLSDAVEAHRTKNGEQKGLVTLSQK